ncbi:hypothetical protein SECTIM467_147 [Brevibacillus phage SecTim467]|uniref:Uncharacterized protein n=2 Tax=Jenstvirus jenst TaxID=1982225 RepID=A0A0K2CNR8_9CAUD|nr:hypothetical protein AVV11_gp049 [Brevibacillus phage Jenst]ALA07271.1 hypothetical protein JENST_142 [Brevibacillus phage Jenst]ALA07472.1 hypothetical protein SECTIM467_147 [Brevibacillus phage SecTim467]
MRIHLYTTIQGVKAYRRGLDFLGWTKDSPKKPEDATLHIDVHENDLVEIGSDGTVTVKGK